MPYLNEAGRKTITAASLPGQSAIVFVTDPARWPEFAAFAVEHSQHPWDEADRRHMRADATLLYRLAESLAP